MYHFRRAAVACRAAALDLVSPAAARISLAVIPCPATVDLEPWALARRGAQPST